MEEEKDFRQWYQNKVRENAQDPPEEVWENICDRLDVKDVWGKVSAKLDEKERISSGKTKIYYATVALILLVMIAGVIGTVKYELFGLNENLSIVDSRYEDFKDEVTEEKVSKSIDQKKLTGKNRISSNLPEEASNVKGRKEDNSYNDHSENKQKIAPEQAAPKQKLENKNLAKGDYNALGREGVEDMPVDKDQKSFQKASSETDRYQKIEFLKPVYPSFSFNLPDMSMIIPDSATLAEKKLIDSITEIDEVEFEKDRQKGSIQIGLTASAKNTWLLNKLTYSGLEKHTLHTTVPAFGKDMGFLIDYGLSEKLGVKGEAIFLSEMGQKYKEYLNGKYVTRKVNLEYYSFNILLKYKAKRLLGERGSDIVVGGYGSALKTAYESINGEEIDQKSQFLPYDFGVVIGYELNREILENLIFTSGLRFNYGLMNIYTDEVNYTSNGSVVLNFAIKYKIPRKK